MGSERSRLPNKMVIKKLKSIICVVDNEIFFFLAIKAPKWHKGTNVLCSQLVPLCIYGVIISYFFASVNKKNENSAFSALYQTLLITPEKSTVP